MNFHLTPLPEISGRISRQAVKYSKKYSECFGI